ncbi:MAG: hypothetical protein AABZ22_05900 [Nitrospirota bacterium]
MAENQQADTLRYVYKFKFEDGKEKNFEIRLNADTLELLPQKDLPKPDWTKLNYFQCTNCPLGDDVAYCPVAVNLSSLVETFKDSISHKNTSVNVKSPERTYEKETTLQKGLSSIIGMYMVTSNCPVMDELRPMVRFHLPFATGQETIYRAVSMYLTKQYFVMRKGGNPDWGLQNLSQIYKAISQVNSGMSERLRHASTEDANVNALIILSSFSNIVDYSLENGLDEIEYLFGDGTT